MNWELLIFVFLVTFVSSLIRVVFGFGHALIAMPLLAMTTLSIREVTPLVALIAQSVALYLFSKEWEFIDLRSTWRLVVSSLAGIPVGIILLTVVNEGTVKLILALFLLAFSLFSLGQPRGLRPLSERWAYPCGFLSGILGGAYNVNGPPVVVYCTLRRLPPVEFRATLQGYFFPTGLLIIGSHGLAGLWTPRVWQLYLLTVPAMVAAVWLGNRIHRALPPRRFELAIHLLLTVIALTLIIHVLG